MFWLMLAGLDELLRAGGGRLGALFGSPDSTVKMRGLALLVSIASGDPANLQRLRAAGAPRSGLGCPNCAACLALAAYLRHAATHTVPHV